MHFSYNSQGCQEDFDLLEPVAVSPFNEIETLSNIFLTLCQYRAALLPKGAKLIYGIVGYHGSPPDSIQATPKAMEGLKSGSTYKFGPPDNMNSCLQLNLNPASGSRSTYWLRLLDDDDVLDSVAWSGSGTNLILTPSALPALPVYGDTKGDIYDKWIKALLFSTVQGRRNPNFWKPIPDVGALPYTYDAWRRAQFIGLSNRKMGKIYKQKAGHRAAFA